MKRISLFFMLGFLALPPLLAQQPSPERVNNLADTIVHLIREHYVLPDKGEQIANYFAEDLQTGRFYQAQTLKQLDSIMTQSLREVSQDFHLYTWNNPEIVQQVQAETEENESEESSNFFNDQKAYQSNFGFDRVEVLPNNIGYLKLSQINISEHSLAKLYAAMKLVANTDALIIDLRDNHGGGSTVGSVLESFFFDQSVDLLEFKRRNGQTEMQRTVSWLLEKRYLKPLYVLINKGTASAAEAFAFALKHQGRCTVIGEASSGGAYMNSYFLVNQDFVIAISTAAPFLPGTQKSWEGKGVQPDYAVESEGALDKVLGLIQAK